MFDKHVLSLLEHLSILLCMHAYVCTSYAHSDFTRALVGVYVIEVTMNLVLI